MLSLYKRYAANASMSYSPSLMPAFGLHETVLISITNDHGYWGKRNGCYVPIRASFTPLSAPSVPLPRKGNITPGVSYA